MQREAGKASVVVRRYAGYMSMATACRAVNAVPEGRLEVVGPQPRPLPPLVLVPCRL